MRFCSLHRGRGSRTPWWWQHCSPLINQRRLRDRFKYLDPCWKITHFIIKPVTDKMTVHLNISHCLNLLIHHVLTMGKGRGNLFLSLLSLLTVNCIAFILPRFMAHSIWKQTTHAWKQEKVENFYSCITSVYYPSVSAITASPSCRRD